MNTTNILRSAALCSAAAAFLVATTSISALHAQETPTGTPTTRRAAPQEPSAVEKTAADYTTTSRMIGAPVFLQASAEKTAEAARAGEKAEQPKAKVTEWLVDYRNGQLSQAVVSIGGFLGIGDKTVLVPINELAWNNSMERYDLNWTAEQLKAKPAFDLDAAVKSGLDASCGYTTAAGMKKADPKSDAEASAHKVTKVVGTEFTMASNCLGKASELASLPVYAGTTEWGTVKDLIVDRKQNRVVLAIVRNGTTLGMGGTDYLIAYPHLVACQKGDDVKLLSAKNSTSAQLESSVHFEAPKNGVVDPAAAKKALAGVSTDEKHGSDN